MTPAEQVLARAADWGRAPSAHNTQPWDVQVAGPDSLTLGWHADRVLEVGDPTRRDLMLSLGCLTEAITIVAAELQYAVRPAWQVDRAGRMAGVLELTRPSATPSRPSASARSDSAPPSASAGSDSAPPSASVPFRVADLRARRTARGDYAAPFVTAGQAAAVAAAAGLPADTGLAVLPHDLVSEQLAVADRWIFDGPAAGELRDWVRLHRGDPHYRQDGLTDRALGLARWQAVGLRIALQPTVLGVLRRTRLTSVLAASSSPAEIGTVVALTAAPGLTDPDLLDLGRVLLLVWLAAGAQGLAAHPQSQLLDCPESAAALAGALPPGRTAYCIFRLGRPVRTPVRSSRVTD